MRILHLLCSLLLLGALAETLQGQTFVTANYVPSTGRPTQLNVCGDTDMAVYRVAQEASAQPLSNITVTVELFEGMRAVGFDASASSPGVSVVSLADPTRPVLSLPNLNRAIGNPSADFALILEARCGIKDSIAQNNLLSVFDEIVVDFTSIGSNRSEREAIDPYLAAITFPVFSLTDSLGRSPLRVGEEVTRFIKIANGSFRGYADTVRYQLEQGPGATVQAIRVNGISKTLTKTLTPAGDTLVELVLAGTDFNANTVGGVAGNGDARFDPDERLEIQEDLLINTCNESRIARHTTLFGCDEVYCDQTEIQSDLPIGSGQPVLEITKTAVFPDVEVGYCQPGEFTIIITNLGRETDPTFGEARDLALSMIPDFGGGLAANGYSISQIDVAGVTLPTLAPVFKLDTIAAFGSDPDGAGGLEDLDGDGFFDDLAILEQFEVKVYYDFDCSAVAGDDLSENCANNATTTFQAYAYYDNACGNRLTGRDINLHSPRNIQDDFEQRTQPDAFSEGAPFQIELEFGRLVFNFENSCSANAEMRAYVVLPQGVTIDAGTSNMSRGGPGMPLLGVTQVADTAMLRFSPAGEAFLSGVYTLTLGLSADCTAPLGETNFPTTVAYFCPDCACEHVWICENIVGPWIHKTSPPCLASELFPCPQGVQGSSFEINRTTFGFFDQNFTNPYDAFSANTKSAIPADSILITMNGTVGDNIVGDSLGVILHYFTPNDQTDTSGLFLLGGGTIEWKDGVTWRTCAIPPTIHTLENDTTETWQRFDLSQCLIDNGWNITPGDSIQFNGLFEINPLGPMLSTYEFVEDLRGGFFAVEGGTETLCDQFGEVFRVGRPFTVFGVPSNGSFPKGCDPASLDFRLTGVNRGYFEEFGNEFRRSARLDSVILTFDPAILTAYEDITVELQVAAHPTQGSTFFPIRPLSDFPDGRYVLLLDTLDHSSNLVVIDPFLYNMRVNLTPNCSSIRSSTAGDALYPMEAVPYYRERYYATDIGAGSGVEIVTEDWPLVMTYEDPAILRMDILTPPYQRITADTAFIQMEICNISTISRAGRSWLTFNDTTTLQIVEAQLIDDPSNPVDLTIETFTGGHYVNMEALEQVNGVNTSTQVCNLVRLKVLTTGCGVNGIRFATGWGCEAAPPIGWTPDLDASCIDDNGLSEFEPIAPFLEADLISQHVAPVDLCTPIILEFQVNNAQAGRAYDILSEFHIPEGLEYIAGSAVVAYPPSSPFQLVVSDLIPSDTTLRGFGWQFPDLSAVHSHLAANGLQGFEAGNPTDSNRFVIQLTFETTCNYRSGSIVYFDAEGNEACGDQTNLAAAESAALEINGVVPDGSHVYTVAFDPDSRIGISTATSVLEVIATNVGTDPTDADDVLQITIPEGYLYEAGTTQGIAPSGFIAAEPIVTVNGAVTMLEFGLPVGMVPGDAARIRFEVRPDVVACGDNPEAAIAAVRYMDAICVSGGTVCRIPTDITQGGGSLVTLPAGDVFVPVVNVNTSTCETADNEFVTIDIDLNATGFVLNGSPVGVTLFYDTNGDQLGNAGDDVISVQSLTNTAGESTVNFSFSGSLDRDWLNDLILFIDSTGQAVCAPQHLDLDLPRLVNAGTQDVFNICISEDASVALGDVNCATATDVMYSWTTAPVGFETFLSDATAANPTFTAPDPYTGPDTILYILESNRLGVGTTSDSVTVVVGPGVTLGLVASVSINYGEAIILTPNIIVGTAPFTYAWTPDSTLSSGTDAQPIANPVFTTNYSVTITDVYGCSATASQEVVVNDPIVPIAMPSDTTICPDGSVLLQVTGGPIITWIPRATNPALGGISTTTGGTVLFASQGGVGEYLFDVEVEDPAFPGYTATTTVRVVSDPNAGCLGRCDFPELISEVVISTECGETVGSIDLRFGASLAGYTSEWTDASGTVLAQNQSTITDLGVGIYRFYAEDVTDPICFFEHFSYVSAANAPLGIVAGTDSDCGASNGSATITPATLTADWPDGTSSLTRSDLAPGEYRVAIYDAVDPTCVRFQTVTIGETNGLVITANTNQLPDCGVANGSVTLDVQGGSGNYDFAWSTNNETNTNLPAGAYHVEVTDRISGCSGEVSFVLQNNVPAAVVNMIGVNPETCPDDNTGSIDFTVGFDGAFVGPADTLIISSRGDTLVNGSLAAGNYCIVILDQSGCVAGGDCITLEAPNAIRIDMEAGDACGTDNGPLNIIVREGRLPFTYTFSDGTVTNDVTSAMFASGAHTVTIADAAGCTVSAGFEIGQCPPCGYFPTMPDTTILQSSCGGTTDFCLPGIATRADEIVIFTGDTLYSAGIVGCDYGRTRLTYLIGILNFAVPMDVTWTVNGTEFTATVATLAELIQFFQDSDPMGNWVYDTPSTAIVGGQQTGVYSTFDAQRQGSSLVNQIPYNERIEPLGLAIQLPPGLHRVIILDTLAPCADTLWARVNCTISDTIEIDIPVTTTDTFCFDTTDLMGNIVSMTNTCLDETYATYTNLNDTCVTIMGNTVGSQTGCWVLCDDLGVCDTTFLIVNVIQQPLIWRDTVEVNGSDLLCLTAADLGLLPGAFTITNNCANASGTFVDIFVDDVADCIEYDGLLVGEETACLEFCDLMGNCVQGQLIVTVIEPASVKTILYDTIFINQTEAICFDTVTNFDELNIFRDAALLVETSVDSLDETCMTYRGLELGQDTLGVEAIRTDGTVEQVCIVITVVPYLGSPEAVSDSTCTQRNTPIRLNVLANDQVYGGVGSFEILDGPDPVDGTVVINSDNTITFTPAADICARDVTFTYQVCNTTPDSCSIATVTICIECDRLIVFTAVSPNGDGMNDVFYVAKIEDFPNNMLRIYNRWGNLVHQEAGYLNTWTGTYEGDPLPDGAYFFILDVMNEGVEDTYRGYIEIMR